MGTRRALRRKAIRTGPATLISLAAALLCAGSVHALPWSSEKQIDAFRSTGQIFVSLVPPAAGSSAAAQVDGAMGHSVEGAESVRFDYTFNALAGGFVEGFGFQARY